MGSLDDLKLMFKQFIDFIKRQIWCTPDILNMVVSLKSYLNIMGSHFFFFSENQRDGGKCFGNICKNGIRQKARETGQEFKHFLFLQKTHILFPTLTRQTACNFNLQGSNNLFQPAQLPTHTVHVLILEHLHICKMQIIKIRLKSILKNEIKQCM